MILGCCSHTTTRPDIALPESFSRDGNGQVTGRWWRQIKDPGLQTLVRQALGQNFNLLIGKARLEQALTAITVDSAPLWPSVNISARGSRDAARNFTLSPYLLTAGASYELDLFGRNWAARNAALKTAEAALANTEVVAITVVGELAAAWYSYIASQERLELIAKQMRVAEQMETLVELRYRAGSVRASDVFRQRQFTEALRTQQIEAQAQVKLSRHLVNALRGRGPSDTLPPVPTSISMLPFPKTGVPSTVVYARPDVRAAFARLESADARVAQAMRNRFPTLSFSAVAGFRSVTISDLLSSWITNITANLFAPVFQGGRLKAEVRRQKAIAKEQAYLYGQAIVAAARDIEDAIALDVQAEQRLASIKEQLGLSNQAVEVSTKQFAKGQVDYLRILDLLTIQQTLQAQFIAAEQNQRAARIRLYRSLATSFPFTEEEKSDGDSNRQ